MKLWQAAAGVAAASAGAYLFARRRPGASALGRSGRNAAAALWGSRVILSLAGRLARKTVQLQACRVDSALTKRGGLRGIARGLRERAREAVSRGGKEAGVPGKA